MMRTLQSAGSPLRKKRDGSRANSRPSLLFRAGLPARRPAYAAALISSLLLSPSALLPGADTAPPPPPPALVASPTAAPAVNWVLPLFTDKEGHRSMTLRGTEVRPAGKNIAVTDLLITVFSGDAAARVESMLLSQQAVFYPKENRATGDGSVRLINDDAEITGTGWSYEHGEQVKKVSLRQNVRIIVRAQLNDILK
jgi:hypothetical protein